MSITYTYSSDWIGRDTQPENSPLRIVKAADFLTEWQAIQGRFAEAAPTNNAALTGTTSTENLAVSGTFVAPGYEPLLWDTAFGWGDHSVEGYLTAELDPTVPAHVKAISTDKISSWDTAYSWGDHSTEGYLKVETDPTVPAYVKAISTGDITSWDEAHGWGDHSTEGYITGFTELDPTVPSHVKAITTTEKSQWNTAHGWGDHGTQGYLKTVTTSSFTPSALLVSSEAWSGTDNTIPTSKAVEERLTTGGFISDYNVTEGDVTQHQSAINAGVQITESQITNLGGGSSYLNDAPSDGSQYSRKDGAWSPITGASGGTVTSVGVSVPSGLSVSNSPVTAAGTIAIGMASGYQIPTVANLLQHDTAFSWGDHGSAGYLVATTANKTNWNTAYGWGDHSAAGYLIANATDKNNWDTAHLWGNHASAGYLTSFTESDPTVPSHVKAITTTKISRWDSAWGWGDHASAGYMPGTTAEKANWDTAYSWGNHAVAGYATNNGGNASGTWGISITGNAASATSATSATTATNCSRSVSGSGNLSGGGALTANRTITMNSTLTSLTDVQTANLSIGSWDIKLEGNDLVFEYAGTDVFKLTTAGAVIAKSDVTAYGAP
jgi:hypothetical protein